MNSRAPPPSFSYAPGLDQNFGLDFDGLPASLSTGHVLMPPPSGPAGMTGSSTGPSPSPSPAAGGRKKSRRAAESSSQKRRCVSTACVACRKRKSKCDGALPSCAACASVYYTECLYDPNSDHRRKGVYREKIDSMKAQNSTLQILIEAILNADEEDVLGIVHKIRTCDSLDAVAESFVKEELDQKEAEGSSLFSAGLVDTSLLASGQPVEGEMELARKMGELRLENGSVRFIGGTSHLIYAGDPADDEKAAASPVARDLRGRALRGGQARPRLEAPYSTVEAAINSWTTVTADTSLIMYLMNMYFNWHYTYFTTLSKRLFYEDFLRGRPQVLPSRTVHCTSLLVNAMLALGCHFTSVPGAFAEPGDSRTKGDHFFAEAKRLIVANDEYEKPRLATVQALALMSVREAGCAREAKGWVYSGMSFRMAQDIGLNLDTGAAPNAAMGSEGDDGSGQMDDDEIDARRVTFWGCFLFDKAWSNYLGRLPQLPKGSSSVPKYDVLPQEDAEMWAALTDAGYDETTRQPCRTRAAGLELSKLCEISSDLLLFFYHPNHIGRSHSKAVELKKLSEVHRRLEDWRRELPKEFEPKEGQRPNVILTHMFFHLQYIHLFRPFLKYAPSVSPLPSHVSPRRICTVNAGAISKLMRLYKKTYNLRQICNIAVYMIHSACTIHMLNLPEKTAKRDIIHGVKQLEEIAEDWLCARRTLCIISVLARKWGVDLPEEALAVLQQADDKYGTFNTSDVPSPNRTAAAASPQSGSPSPQQYAQAMADKGPVPGVVPGVVSVAQGPPAGSATGPYEQRPPPPPPTFGAYLGPASAGSTPSSVTVQSVTGALGELETLSSSVFATSNGSLSAPVGSWSMTPPGLPASMPGFGPQLAPVHGPAVSPGVPTMAATQHMGSPVYTMDGQDWLLREGASWQHNFEAWDMSPHHHHQQYSSPPPPPPTPLQNQGQQHFTAGTGSPASTGNVSTPMSDTYALLRGANGVDFDMPLEGLGGSGVGLDGLGVE